MTNQQPIKPVFSFLLDNGKTRIRMDDLENPDDFFTRCLPEEVEISLDGVEFHSLARLNDLVELGLQFEYAMEHLSPPKENK